jgi:tRNA-dihydrouridine synthase
MVSTGALASCGFWDIDVLIIINPTIEALQTALRHFDYDGIMVGGYCYNSCSKYWDELISKAYLSL